MYDVGDTVPLGVAVRDDNGDLVDAASVVLQVRLPDGTVVTPAVTHVSVGRYDADYVTTVPGRHYWRCVSTTPDTAYTDMFDVAGDVGLGVVSLEQAKKYLHIPDGDSTEDEQLRVLIGAITRVIEGVIGAVLVTQHTETWSGRGQGGIVLTRGPIVSVDSVTVNGSTLDSSGYSLSDTGILYRVAGFSDLRWPTGRNNVVVVYTVGRAQSGPNVVEAALELVRINFRPVQGGNFSPFDPGGDQPDQSQDGTWRLGFFLPHGVRALLLPDQDPGGLY